MIEEHFWTWAEVEMGRDSPSLFFIEIINRSFEESWKISPSVTEETLMRAGLVETVSVHALWMLFSAFHLSRGLAICWMPGYALESHPLLHDCSVDFYCD